MPKNQTEHETEKKEYKDYSSLRAWQVGHEINLQLHAAMQEYRSDQEVRPWADSVILSMRDSVVQIMEAFRKYPAAEKLKRYEASMYYANQAHYTLILGEELGFWSLSELISKLIEYERIVKSTSFHFLDKKEKKV